MGSVSEGRTALGSALREDIELGDARQSIDELMAAQVTRLSEGRESPDARAGNEFLGIFRKQGRAGHIAVLYRRSAGPHLADGRAALASALEDDLQKLGETRQHIHDMVSAQVAQLSEGRDIFKRALEADLDRIKVSKEGLDELMTSVAATHAEQLAQGRSALADALADDLAKLAETRQDIDTLVSGQVEHLTEGRNVLKRALEEDLAKITSSKEELDHSSLLSPRRMANSWTKDASCCPIP